MNTHRQSVHEVALDTERMAGTYTGSAEGHGNQREAAFVAAGDALLACAVPVTLSAPFSGAATPV